MSRLFLLVFTACFWCMSVQAQLSEGEVEFSGSKKTVKTMDINNAPDIVEQAIKNKMAKAGYKPKESKGWMIFKSVNDPELSDEPCDLHVKVEKKSRKEKDASVVYFFISKPNDHTRAALFSGAALGITGFHSQVTAHADAHQLEKDIQDQEETTKKAEKKYDDLVKEQSSLEKKIKNLQEDLESNKEKQQSQMQEVENQRKALELLKGKRKG